MEGATFAADPMRLMIATAGKSAAKESVERFRKYIIFGPSLRKIPGEY